MQILMIEIYRKEMKDEAVNTNILWDFETINKSTFKDKLFQNTSKLKIFNYKNNSKWGVLNQISANINEYDYK